MLAELVDHVIGIDPDRDWITAAVVDAKTTGVIATESSRRTTTATTKPSSGPTPTLRRVIAAGSWRDPAATDAVSPPCCHASGEWVIEFDRLHQRPTKDGAKTDELDVVRAAREALGRNRLHTRAPMTRHREALRVHTVTRAGVVRVRTAAINELEPLAFTSPDELRSRCAVSPRPS